MRRFKVTLGIGVSNAGQEDILEFEDEDVPTDEVEFAKWLDETWQDWAWNFIDGGIGEV